MHQTQDAFSYAIAGIHGLMCGKRLAYCDQDADVIPPQVSSCRAARFYEPGTCGERRSGDRCGPGGRACART